MRQLHEIGNHALLYTVIGKETSRTVITYRTDESRAHAQIGERQHRIARRTSRGTLHIEHSKALLYASLFFITDKGHTTP